MQAIIRRNARDWAIAHQFIYFGNLEKLYTIPKNMLETILAPYGEISGKHEYFVFNEKYLIHPVFAGVTFDSYIVNFFIFSTKPGFEEVKEKLLADLTPYIKTDEQKISVCWAIPGKNPSSIQYADIDCVLVDRIHQEAYPYIPNLDTEVKAYLEHKSPILILHGQPGTGKTRLIKYILQMIGLQYGRTPSALFSMDEKIFGNEGFFFHFLTNPYDALVLEDIDLNLKARNNGNFFMYKLLGGSDGFVSTQGKKIIMSTNLPSLEGADEALLRPGRCYKVLKMQKLVAPEAKTFVEKVFPDKMDAFNALHTKAAQPPAKYTLADLYNL